MEIDSTTQDIKKTSESIYKQTSDTRKTTNFRASYPLNPDLLVSSFLLKASKDEALKLSTENSVGSGLVNCMVDGMIGSGLSLESVVSTSVLTISKKKIAKNSQLIEEYWNLWAKTPEACDVLGENTLGAMTRVAAFNGYATGDVLQFIGIHNWNGIYVPYVRYYDGRSVMNKDDAANTERMVSGVKLDEKGVPVGYSIKSETSPYSYEYKEVSRFAKYPGSDLNRLQYNLILTGKVQPNQRRGRPLVLPAMNDIIMMNKFSEAELVKAVIHSYITAFVERDKDLLATNPSPSASDDAFLGTLDRDKKADETGSKESPITMGPGYIQTLAPGEKITLPESKSPVAEFWKFMEGQLKLVCMAVGIPYEVALQVFNSNYSASQAAIQAAARKWDIERKAFAMQAMQPVYELMVWLLNMQGIVNCPGYQTNPFVRAAWNNANWHGPVVLNIDPVKNATAATLRLNNMTSTYEDECRLLGKDFDKVLERRKQEAEMLDSHGLKPDLTVDKKNVMSDDDGGGANGGDGGDGGEKPADEGDDE
jgi:lambda family phage portal protein